jgi:hypothetical protein
MRSVLKATFWQRLRPRCHNEINSTGNRVTSRTADFEMIYEELPSKAGSFKPFGETGLAGVIVLNRGPRDSGARVQ